MNREAMPKKTSAGILLWRVQGGTVLEVFLVHPGGPFWKGKDQGAWSIPKGELSENEDPLSAAIREFQEEVGQDLPGLAFVPLQPLKQPGGKLVRAWAARGDCDESKLRSNTFSVEWPPRSGHFQDFPEVDRAAWFSLEEARTRLLRGQVGFIDELQGLVSQREMHKSADPRFLKDEQVQGYGA